MDSDFKDDGCHQAAEASAQVATASAALGPGASEGACATLLQALPTVLGCAPRAVQADVQLALSRALLATAKEEQLREEPDKCAPLSIQTQHIV